MKIIKPYIHPYSNYSSVATPISCSIFDLIICPPHLLKYLCTYQTVSFLLQLGEPPFEKCCFHKWVCPLRGKRVQKKCTTYHPFDRGGGGLKLFGSCPYGHISKRGFTYRRIAFIPHVSRCGIQPCYQLCLPNSASRNSFLMVPVLRRGDKSRGAPTWGQSLTP